MPTLDDLPTLKVVTNTNGADLIPVYDVESNGSTKVGALPLYGLLGLQAGDVATIATGATISTRLSVVTGTTPTVTLPAVAGNLRYVAVMNTATGAALIQGAGSEQILTALANAPSLSVPTTKSAVLLSDGTRWYHVSNDA